MPQKMDMDASELWLGSSWTLNCAGFAKDLLEEGCWDLFIFHQHLNWRVSLNRIPSWQTHCFLLIANTLGGMDNQAIWTECLFRFGKILLVQSGMNKSKEKALLNVLFLLMGRIPPLWTSCLSAMKKKQRYLINASFKTKIFFFYFPKHFSTFLIWSTMFLLCNHCIKI